jgi:hypothetical protein
VINKLLRPRISPLPKPIEQNRSGPNQGHKHRRYRKSHRASAQSAIRSAHISKCSPKYRWPKPGMWT